MILAWACLLISTTTSTPAEARESLALMSDEDAWREPGFRVGLGYAADGVIGVGGVPGGLHHSAVLQLGPRLDRQWSLFGTFRYGVHLGKTAGLRFSGTLEPTLDLTDHLSLAIGLGVGGFVISSTGSPTPQLNVVASRTIPGTDPLLGACTGTGVLALARLEYSIVVNSLLAMSPALQLDGQWTACTEQLGRSDPDTGESIVLHQFWQNYGVSVAWLFWWR